MYEGLKDKQNRDILVPGSHDAGIMTSTAKPDYYRSQTFSIAQQMCRGFRFFDIRIKQKNGIFHLLHPGFDFGMVKVPDGWAASWDDVSLSLSPPLIPPPSRTSTSTPPPNKCTLHLLYPRFAQRHSMLCPVHTPHGAHTFELVRVPCGCT